MTAIAAAAPTFDYYLFRRLDGRTIVDTEVPADATLISGPAQAADWRSAREMLREDIVQHLKLVEAEQKPVSVHSEPLFGSVHEALTFAFRFNGQQSPKTPMSGMTQASGIGTGRGLTGVDGAAQAGMILAALKHLTDEQRHVLIARYGDVRKNCVCCGQPAADPAWLESVEALSQCGELNTLPKAIRISAIEKAVCRKKVRVQDYAVEYGLSVRTLRHKLTEVKQRFGKVENSAVAWLTDFFQARGVLA